MDNVEFIGTVKNLIDCIKCSFGIIGYEDIDCSNINELVNLSINHSIDAIIYPVIKKIYSNESSIISLLEERYNRAIMIDATQKYYLELIENEFENHGIRYCVMKGPVIKELYPLPEMRKSGDIDIYVDDENTEIVKKIMTDLGFEIKTFNRSVGHDEYCIDKVIEVEIHRTLISNKCPWDRECQKIVDRLLVSDGYKYRSEMTKEDYYLYMIAHMAKHMRYSGIGIRMVIDVWLYIRTYKNVLKFDEINHNLKSCGLLEFENNIRELCSYWFDDIKINDKIQRLGLYIALSGDFGTYDQLISSELARNTGKSKIKFLGKLKLYFSIYFMPYKKMKEKYTILTKLPLLLPYFWIHRAVKGIAKDNEKAKRILCRYDNVDLDYGQELIEFKKEIGL